MSLWDDLGLVVAAGSDLVGNVNPLDERFLSGDAPLTAALAESQNAKAQGRDYSAERAAVSAQGGVATLGDAATATARDATDAVGRAVEKGVAWLPWLLGAGLVLGAVLAVRKVT